MLIAIKKSFNCVTINLADFIDIEICCSKITLRDSAIWIMCLYIPPASNIFTVNKYIDAIVYVESLISKTSDGLLIFGDFNLPGIVWEPADSDGTSMFPGSTNTVVEMDFVDACLSLGLCQINCIRNHQGRLLDLIFTNCSDEKQVAGSTDALVSEDLYHPALVMSCCFASSSHTNFSYSFKFDFKNANYAGLVNELAGYDCTGFMLINDVDELCDEFYRMSAAAIMKHVPVIKVKSFSESHCPWMNSLILDLKRSKNKAYRKWRLSGSSADLEAYKLIKASLKTSLSSAYHQYIRNIQTSIKSKPDTFWSYIRSVNKTDGFPNSMLFNNIESDDPLSIANMFASFFESVYVLDKTPVDLKCFDYLIDSPSSLFGNFSFSGQEVLDYLSSCDLNHCPGPDGLPSSFFRRCAVPIHLLIRRIFNVSLASSCFPSAWKFSYIFPIFKAGLKNKVENYRGICKQSALPKALDFLVSCKLQFYCKNIISIHQHGFMRGRSTASNLLTFTDYVVSALDNRTQVDAVYTDFSKAFDRVNHNVLLLKLVKLGFPLFFINWLKSFLSSRSQKVLFRDKLSRPIVVLSGVPQGSHIGPLLFNLFINDIVLFLPDCDFLLFADDIKIFKIIRDLNSAVSLQKSISSLCHWCVINRLPLNTQKCCCISFSRRSVPINFDYSIQGLELERKIIIKDLGILLDTKLNFNCHIDMIVKKAYRSWGMIRRYVSDFSDPYVLNSLFVSFVRSILEYCSAIWSPMLPMPPGLRPFRRNSSDMSSRVFLGMILIVSPRTSPGYY